MNNITAVIPAYSDKCIVNNSVISLATQWIPNNTFKLEIIIINDKVDKPYQYDYYLSQDFKVNILKPNIELKIINNKSNVGQGESRNNGIKAASNKWILLCDEDDSYACNAVYRFWEILKKEHNEGEEKKPVALIAAPIYGFDKEMYRQLIPSNSIWVNSKLYNREFLEKHNIWFPTGSNSHRSEDYPFIRCLDYAIAHDNTYKRIDISEDTDTFYWWYPNPQSRSRCDAHYGSLLAGYTMKSSAMIFDYFEKFSKKHGIEKDEDEFLKHEILNMTCYSWFNFLWFLKDLAQGWDDCKEEYWTVLTEGLSTLRTKLLKYYDEIVPSDIVAVQFNVKNNSDCRFVESWLGSFESFVLNDCEVLHYSFDKIKEYCKTLQFDAANHEIHASYVKAWKKRHKINLNINNK